MNTFKRLTAMLLSTATMLSPVSGSLVQQEITPVVEVLAEEPLNTYHWYYNQIPSAAQRIYNRLVTVFGSNNLDGKSDITDLLADNVVTEQEVKAYLDGDRTLFNNFVMALDAVNLEHPEFWTIDYNKVALRVSRDNNGKLYARVGIGPSDYYLKTRELLNNGKAMTAAVTGAINNLVSKAGNGDAASKAGNIHDAVTKAISYRNENEVSNTTTADLIRSPYALITHAGVCEGYARSIQWALNKLGIENVLIHGVQRSYGDQQHMWNAVKVDGNWYIVDATWDDPQPNVENIKAPTNGNDGGEYSQYLLAGKDKTSGLWVPSSIVSISQENFETPQIADFSYGTNASTGSGLQIVATDEKLENIDGTRYHISYNGMNLGEMERNGYYLIYKLYQITDSGKVNAFDEWYYAEATLRYMSAQSEGVTSRVGNDLIRDENGYLSMINANCDYVEFAITTRPHYDWQTSDDFLDDKGDFTRIDPSVYRGGYFRGSPAEILVETGKMANANGSYTAAPQIAKQLPIYLNAKKEQDVTVEFNDDFYLPTGEILNKFENLYQQKFGNPSAASLLSSQDLSDEIFTKNYSKEELEWKIRDIRKALDLAQKGMTGKVTIEGSNYNWLYESNLPHEFSKEPKITAVSFNWTDIPDDLNHTHSFDDGCTANAVTFHLIPSDMWADDSVRYEFTLNGLVGVSSNKAVSVFSTVVQNETLCSCRLVTGVDWNLWGHPVLMDGAESLDLDKMSASGVDGKSTTLAELNKQMLNENGIYNRLMLVVEDLSGDGSDNSLTDTQKAMLSALAGKGEDVNGILSRTMYEISFSRVCSMLLNELDKGGSSVRVQMGFPLGYDATSNVTFKAYHFTRDDNGNILSVEAIPVTITPYGLIVQCNKFSPFIIFASNEKPNQTPKLIISKEGEGKVLLNGKDVSVSADSIIDLDKNIELTLEPEIGYVLDSATYTGTGIKQEGTKISIPAGSANNTAQILHVSFIKKAADQSIKEAHPEEETLTPQVTLPEGTGGTELPDGVIVEEDGTVVIPEKDGTVLKSLKIQTKGSASTITSVKIPGNKTDNSFSLQVEAERPVVITIPVENGSAGTVALIKNEDGSLTPVIGSYVKGGKFILPADGSGIYIIKNNAKSFPDLIPGNWDEEGIAFCSARKILNGYENGFFGSNDPVTRGQMAMILWNMNGNPPARTNLFNDVASNAFYQQAASWNATRGFMSGYEDGRFGGEDFLSREQLATVLHRIAGTPSPSGNLSAFADGSQHGAFAERALQWAVGTQLIKGEGSGLLNATGTGTRGQIATILYRYLTMD